jgi:methyltransferase
MITSVILAVVGSLMAGEAILSRAHERTLRREGAIEPEGDVMAAMQMAYPGAFLAMAVEGAIRGAPAPGWLGAGILVFGTAKILKYWAIASLGRRWTFRVLVLPGVPLVASGPYRYLRHPNYVAVAGELAGAAMMLASPWSGCLGTLGFIYLMRCRIAVEERALGLQ